jgi:hypothetical protein
MRRRDGKKVLCSNHRDIAGRIVIKYVADVQGVPPVESTKAAYTDRISGRPEEFL